MHKIDSQKFNTTSNVLDVIKESDIIFVFSETPINLEGNYDTASVFNDLVHDKITRLSWCI